MAKKIQNKRYLVNRAVYKAVKKYDHQQFENFCTDIYKSGWEDGKASVNALDVKDIEAVIKSVKGIGEVRIGKIMEAINEKFDENAGSEETEETVRKRDPGQPRKIRVFEGTRRIRSILE